MDWMQVDGDSSVAGGYYDGWVWSDARACGSDHSFKSTMYDEYKNMQDDWLIMKNKVDLTQTEYELCDGSCLEIDEIGLINISFDVFVDGEYKGDSHAGGYFPLDYLDFGFIDGTGYYMPWSDPISDTSDQGLRDYHGTPYWDYTDYAQKIDGCPGWWHVWMEISPTILELVGFDISDIGPYFQFVSDKERVYEGAYVDNVKIEIEEFLGEKVYQGHSQDWITETEEGISCFEFPLDWTNDIEPSIDIQETPQTQGFPGGYEDKDDSYYVAIIKLKDDSGGYADNFECMFEIGDMPDCDIYDVFVDDLFDGDSDPDTMLEYPSDAKISFTYENMGNVPLENIPITATAYKVSHETLFEEDFESMSNWVAFYPDYNLNVVTVPDFTGENGAWSGSRALYLGNPDTWHVDIGEVTQYIEYIGYSQSYFSIEDAKNIQLDMYYKGVLPDGADFSFCVLGSYYIITGVPPTISGPHCQKSWVGPMQPQEGYTSVSLDGIFDWMHQSGYFLDENGHDTYDTGIGVYLDTTFCNEQFPANCFAPGETIWSGIFIDDVSVTAEVLTDVVWEDSMVIPGPCDPGEHCSDYFIWEDVPYSNYEVVIEGPSSNFPGTVSHTQHCWDSAQFRVLEKKEILADHAEGIDYTECSPETWCISNVVGNDCANDHYALATNCDTYWIPEGVDDFIGGTIDIEHLTIAPPPTCTQIFLEDFSGGVVPPAGWSVGYLGWPDISYTANAGGTSPEADFDWYGLVTGDHLESDPGTLPDGDKLTFKSYIYHYSSSYTYSCVVYVNGDDVTPWSNPITGDVAAAEYEIDISSYTNPQVRFEFQGDSMGMWDWYIDDIAVWECSSGGGSGTCTTIFDTSFEGTPWDGEFDTNTGWLDSLYGGPCDGAVWAYSWSNIDVLTTPTLNFEAGSTTLTFQHRVESPTHPMDMQVRVDGTDVVESLVGVTNTDCILYTVDLSSYTGPHTVGFYGLTDDFYGQCLDDIEIITCEPGSGPAGDELLLNMTYQMDSNFPVFLEVAGFNLSDGDTCDGCDDWDEACPVSNDAWVVVDSFVGNNPGLCQYASVDLLSGLTHDYDRLCYRFRLDTMSLYNNPYQAEDPGWTPSVQGIGMHIHQMSLDNALSTEECTDYDSDTVLFNFEDATMDGCVGPAIQDVDPAAEGWWMDNVQCYPCECPVDTNLMIGCYQGGNYWKYMNDAWSTWSKDSDGNDVNEFPAQRLHNALVWSTEIEDAYEAYLYADIDYDLGDGQVLKLELSADGGDHWFIIEKIETLPAPLVLGGYVNFDGLHDGRFFNIDQGAAIDPTSGSIIIDGYDLTPWAGQDLLIRVMIDNVGVDMAANAVPDTWYAGTVTINEMMIWGKSDVLPPTATISLSGNMVGPGVYAGPVTVTITGKDDKQVGEIHYILDGTETVVEGDKATFKVTADGDHSVEYWAVDGTGNEGAHGSTSFSIDNSPPTVAITAPEPGLYLFGNKLLSMSKPFS
jgi:hypothetical protein